LFFQQSFIFLVSKVVQSNGWCGSQLLHPRARVEVESFKCQRAAKNAIFPAAQLQSAIQRRREVKEQHYLKGRVGCTLWLAGVDFKIPLAPQIAELSRRRPERRRWLSPAHIEMIHTWQARHELYQRSKRKRER
jgi:hypothetical protein